MAFDPDEIFLKVFPDQGDSRRSNAALVCHQHLLPSVLPQFSYLMEHQFHPENIFILGKPYSTISEVVSELSDMGANIIENRAPYERGKYHKSIEQDVKTLWRSVAKRHNTDPFRWLILLDEGGFLATTVPEQLRDITTAVEQTTSGSRIFNQLVVPTIQIATSAGKRYFESPEIGRAIWSRFEIESGQKTPCNVGILGTGFIGKAIAECAKSAGCSVLGFDIDQRVLTQCQNIKPAASIVELLDQSDVIFGCAGAESLELSNLENREVLLISASSGDSEFARILESNYFTSKDGLLSDIRGTGSYQGVKILNGGFPYNFNTRYEYENPKVMILTRLLMISGIEQALELRTGAEPNIQLAAQRQLDVVSMWDENLKAMPQISIPTDLDWWQSQSG